jgi:pilus assembly protein Flp/PilA
MNSGKTIRAQISLRCSIQLTGTSRPATKAVTSEIARESVVLMVAPTLSPRWLCNAAQVLIAIDLPCTGLWTPRVLECAATIFDVSELPMGMRIAAGVHRMTVTGRDPGIRNKNGRTGLYGTGCSAAVAEPRNLYRVTPTSPNNQLSQGSTDPIDQEQGEQSMSFLKNLFTEEDGQDMVEYGLVIALVVLAAGAILTGFKTNIGTAFTALGTDVTTQVK